MIRNTFEWDTIISDMSPNPDAPIDYVELARFVLQDLTYYLGSDIDTETDDVQSLAALLALLHSYTAPERVD